jgi:hypothetical protein
MNNSPTFFHLGNVVVSFFHRQLSFSLHSIFLLYMYTFRTRSKFSQNQLWEETVVGDYVREDEK